MKARYAGEVTMVDRWLGNFLDKMEELDLFDNTLLLLIADHGIAHAEHGIAGKPSYALWPEVTDIPFFIRHPEGRGAGEVSDYYASTHDVAPTVLGFLGIEPPRSMDGQDLLAQLEGEDPEPRRSEEHTSELQSRQYLVCRLLLEKKQQLSHPRPDVVCV